MTPEKLKTLVDYYVDRLAFQYRGLPRARAHTAILVKQALGDGLIESVQDAFNLDTAIGAQLDVLGKYIGLSRRIGDPIPRPFFGFKRAAGGALDNSNGFRSVVDNRNLNVVWYLAGFFGTSNTDLSDDQYRAMLKMRVAINNSDMSLASIQQILASFFPGQVTVIDNLDMTLTYNIVPGLSVSVGVLRQVLPVPMGCSITVNDFYAYIAQGSYVSPGTYIPGVVVFTNIDVIVTGGVAPYAYALTHVSGDTLAPIGSDGHYSLFNGVAHSTKNGTYKVVVTDANGQICSTPNITANLIYP